MVKILVKIFELFDDLAIKYFNGNMLPYVTYGLWMLVSTISLVLSLVAYGGALVLYHGTAPFLAVLATVWMFISVVAVVLFGVLSFMDAYGRAHEEFEEKKRIRNKLMDEI